MDKVMDSGSIYAGSIPARDTKKTVESVKCKVDNSCWLLVASSWLLDLRSTSKTI